MPSRLRRLAYQAAFGLALLLLPAAPSKAQFLGFGYGGFGYPGYGFGYPGFGYPGFGVVSPFGFPTAVGFGAYGFGNPYFGGGLYSPLGMGGYGSFGNYPLDWYNPATLSMGFTPLAIQSAVMDRGLNSGDKPRAGARLPAGTYRIEIRRVEPPPPKPQP